MKIISFLILISLIASAFVYGGDIAPLGKQLQKKYISMSESEQTVVVIYLTDKGDVGKFKATQAQSFITDRSIRRRLKVRTPAAVIDERDYPVSKLYVDAIGGNVLQIRHQLKWFNAISAIATKSQIDKIRKFNFVKEIELVGRWKKDKESEKEQLPEKEISAPEPSGTTAFDYGTSYIQVNQINVPVVHDKGIYGQGVVVGVFDNGFRILNHESFLTMNIIAQYDFVDHKESVIPNNTATNFGSHGVNTLSTIGGFKSGQLIGPAFGADYILARTENDSSETPIEEDYWAAAIEWADSIGVDVTSTSLGYLAYNAPYTSWTWEDMDGNTTLITRAADHAVSLGIVIVNSAGNNGDNSEHNTLNAPADGDSVITAGAVTSAGERSSFSSVGPTTAIPARIKPDVMAMGSGVKVASSTNPIGYGSASGTSFSCPLSAGVAALILSANPTLAPMQVREAMRLTASNAAVPDNLMGWGILNADSAIGIYGILPLAAVSGTVYADLNSNGVQDPGDTSLSGIKIYITGSATDSTYTDGSGSYNFDSLAIGAYIISQENIAGWKRTTAPYSVYLLHTTDTSGLDFGNFRLAKISGSKFNDLNINGILDGIESGMDNWVFILSNGDTSYRAVTQDGGTFTFSDIDTGTYVLSESIRVGWFQTIPSNYGSYPIAVHSNLDTSGFIFGNYYMPDSTYRISIGWNMLSFPKIVSDYSIAAYYPTATSELFIYSNGYTDVDTIPPKFGYWLKSSATQNVIIQGSPRMVDTIDLAKGWNLIGSIDDTIPKSSLIQIPDTVIGMIFGLYGGYYQEPPGDLYPHHGYWVKAKTDGKIVMNASWKSRQSDRNDPYVEVFKPANTITFTDTRGREQKLHFGFDADHIRMQESYELPPPPPDGVFDVRFNDNLTLTATDKVQSTKNILINSSDYPITMRWTTRDAGAFLIIDKRRIELKDEGHAVITETPLRISLILEPSEGREIPKTFALEQNFPNPFNPLTSIRYQLPVSGWVTVKIYNSFGQEITTLVDGPQEAGYKSVEWDATEQASGVYFYRLIAGTFISTKKMVLIR